MADQGSSIAKDAVSAVSIAGRIVNYFFLAMFTLGLAIVGIASFMTGEGSTAERVLRSLGYVALFGAGFGILFLAQYVARSVLFAFLRIGAQAVSADTRGAEQRARPPGDPPPAR